MSGGKFFDGLECGLGYLSCPNCGEDAAPTDKEGCLACFVGACEGSGDLHHVEPVWTEGDGVTCPECKAALRVVVDEDHAYLTEVES